MIYRIRKNNRQLKGKIQLTRSKSISNRLLIIRALCKNNFQIENLATANDTLLLQKLLSSSSVVLNAEDAGTTFRFLTALLSIKTGSWQLTGTDRMQHRPVGLLVDALRKLGAEIYYEGKENFPPLKINGKKITGGEIELDGSVSSQFVSALLMIAPVLESGLKIKLTGEITSGSYIDMTLQLMSEFGIHSERTADHITIPPQDYFSENFSVESDWSAASYWYEMAALSDDVDLAVVGLKKKSIQGDSVISQLMKPFGVETEYTDEGIRLTKNNSVILPKKITADFKSCPDLLPAMAVTTAALSVEADFQGIRNLRIKESDRLVALKNELEKTGPTVNFNESEFQIRNPQMGFADFDFHFSTYKDHRMAMSLAPLALISGEIKIKDPEVVNKSYPEFWEDLKAAGFEINEI
jgi:3-phosphoshikimate 1-carboxyvinyltransferase